MLSSGMDILRMYNSLKSSNKGSRNGNVKYNMSIIIYLNFEHLQDGSILIQRYIYILTKLKSYIINIAHDTIKWYFGTQWDIHLEVPLNVCQGLYRVTYEALLYAKPDIFTLYLQYVQS